MMRARDNLPTKFILPAQISQQDIEKYNKKYNFSEISQLGFGLKYKARWNTWSAIREFVQNAFDVISENHSDRKALETVSLEYEDGIGYIIDDESGIKYKNMFLAETKEQTSIGIDCLRGKFGEGMKFALIPLLREGHSVIIRTVGFDYYFCSVVMSQGDFDLIHLFQLPNKIDKGTCIAIQGVDPTEYRDRFVPLRLVDSPEDLLLEAKHGCKVRQVLKRKKDVGSFYIRDIFICEINSLYDYNFWFRDPTRVLDPDRNSIRADKKDFFLKEFITLLGTLNTRYGEVFWNNFFKNLSGEKGYLEYLILDYSSSSDSRADSITRSIANKLFSCLSSILESNSFGWSEDYGGGKELEHYGVVDLQGKLPNLSFWLGDLVLTPEKIVALRKAHASEQVVILPEDFSSLGQNIVETVRLLYERLNHISEEICLEEFNVDPPPIYIYIGQEDDRIGHSGHTNFKVINLNWDIIERAIINIVSKQGRRISFWHSSRTVELATTSLIKTLLHELSHYCCYQTGHDNCSDLREDFENTMESMMIAFGKYTAFESDPGLVRSIREIRKNYPLVSIMHSLILELANNYRNLLVVENEIKRSTDRAVRMKKIDDMRNRFYKKSITKDTIKKNRKKLIQRALKRRLPSSTE